MGDWTCSVFLNSKLVATQNLLVTKTLLSKKKY